MREIMKMILVLSLICGLSGLTLGALRDATTDRIEEQVLTYVQGPALDSVFPLHDNNPVKERKTFDLEDGESVTVFPAIKDGKLQSVAFESSAQGYGGDIGVMVGFSTTSDTLAGIGITTLKETPGLGARIVEPDFTGQFKGHSLTGLALTADGGDIDAVSGATISSRATMEALNKALNTYHAIRPELAGAFAQ